MVVANLLLELHDYSLSVYRVYNVDDQLLNNSAFHSYSATMTYILTLKSYV